MSILPPAGREATLAVTSTPGWLPFTEADRGLSGYTPRGPYIHTDEDIVCHPSPHRSLHDRLPRPADGKPPPDPHGHGGT